MSETQDVVNELQMLPKPKTTVEYLDCLADYFVLQGTYKDDVILDSIKQIMRMEKSLVLVSKVLS